MVYEVTNHPKHYKYGMNLVTKGITLYRCDSSNHGLTCFQSIAETT